MISLSPNTEPDDIRVAWRTLFSPACWQDAELLRKAEQEIANLFLPPTKTHSIQPPHVAATSSGRSAIYHTLQALEVGEGDEVITQAFTCLAVPAAIKWAKATPVFADINQGDYNLDPSDVEKKITPNTKAIILQHTFGIPADIKTIQAIAKKHGITIIEDCAHALGAHYPSETPSKAGLPVGTVGDVAILSFGRDKTVSCIFGGAVISKNQQLIDKIKKAQKDLPLPPRWWTVQQLLHPILMSFIKPLYFKVGVGKVMLVALQKMHLLSKAISAEEKAGKMPAHVQWQMSPGLAALLLNQLPKLKRFTEHRRRIAYHYKGGGILDKELERHLDTAAWLRVPMKSSNPSEILGKAKKNQMLLGDWYHTPITPCHLDDQEITGYKPGSCPEAEKASKGTVNLPTYPLLTTADLEHINAIIK